MKNKFKKLIPVVIAVSLLLILVTCIANSGSDPDSNNSTTTTTTKTNTNNSVGAKISVDAKEIENNIWKMTYTGCKIEDKLDWYNTSGDGKEFVIAFFELENISDKEQSFSIMWEKFYIDGIKTPQTVYGGLIDDSYQLTSVSVDPGRKVKGYFLFEVPTDWRELEIIYDESILDENEENIIKFTLTKESK